MKGAHVKGGRVREVFAVGGILWRNGAYLAVERPEGKIMAGYWEFPGGKIEPGETPLGALRRELEEELGVTGVSADFWQSVTYNYTHGLITLHLFHVPAWTGEPAPLENQALRWVSPAQAQTLKFLPADLPVVAELAAMPPEMLPG